jgi:quercetin dioxygenase-like cupin family protein
MDEQDTSKFKIIRAKDGKDLMEAKCMTVAPWSETARAGMDRAVAAGIGGGDKVTILVDIPGFSIANVWFKHGYPLPLHSHSADCLYYIVAGSLKLGTEELGPRDSFFVPADVPYTYKPGPDGVELLEIRTQNAFDFVNYSNGAAFWDKAVESVEQHRDHWKTDERPKIDA